MTCFGQCEIQLTITRCQKANPARKPWQNTPTAWKAFWHSRPKSKGVIVALTIAGSTWKEQLVHMVPDEAARRKRLNKSESVSQKVESLSFHTDRTSKFLLPNFVCLKMWPDFASLRTFRWRWSFVEMLSWSPSPFPNRSDPQAHLPQTWNLAAHA